MRRTGLRWIDGANASTMLERLRERRAVSNRRARRRRLMSVVPLVLVCAIASPVRAQGAVTAGQRVRVKNTYTPHPLVGTLVSADSASIRVVDGKDTVALSREWVRGVEVSTGRHRHPLKGLGIGLASGLTVGALVGALSYQPCHETGFLSCLMSPTSRGESAAMGAAVLGALGGPIGLLIGSLNQTDSWAPASIGTTAQIRIVPQREGVGAQLSVSF